MSILERRQKPEKRCAIYTRKSTDLGLDRDFNTLEGQRAMCSAYVTSQRHKNWRELADAYDDGGFSGKSLDRPNLQRLLADVERGLVDVVVVYKLDRMTRTLLDFVRLIDFFERYGVEFVSITQNFDTADSMGRLVLNILLTFAQFEREMAADRIRDKMLITKQSGRWAGGPAPIGYDLIRRRLHVNPTEAVIVRRIFARYVELQNLTAVFNECREDGICSKQWRTRAGRMVGGGPITKALCHHILKNPIYLGLIKHREDTYEGLHARIVDRDTWDKVQAIQAAQAKKRSGRNKRHILTDLLFDSYGRPMSVNTYFAEGRSKKTSRSYVSRQSAWGKRRNLKPLRARGDEIEHLVVSAVVQFLSDRTQVRSLLIDNGCYDDRLDELARRCQAVGMRLNSLSRDRLRLALRALVARIELSLDRVKVILRASETERYLSWDGVGIFKANLADWPYTRTYLLDLPAAAIRCRRLLYMPVEPRREVLKAHPSPGLKRLIREARHVQSIVDEHRDKRLSELAAQIDYTPDRFARVLRLNYLAPDIIAAIIDGSYPKGLTRRKLVQAAIPMDWALQRKLLGFPDRQGMEGA